ncbi:MAG: hypothetical protein NTU47_14475 [Ignavibacteriales bacterium]|nr:hypothetical protein [Ignavibacteriales bacterium]
MSTMVSKCFLWTLMVLLIAAASPASGTPATPQNQNRVLSQAEKGKKDSADKAGFANVDEMARRVDSLQFIVVYNAQLLRRDLDSKVVWIYVMLGVMIIASMMMYGALNQAQRQRKDLEARVFDSLATSAAELDAKIKQLESAIQPPAPPKRPPSPRKKK